MLVHSYDGRIDDLYASIMGGSECIQNLVPNSSPSPAHEAIVASGVRAEGLRQIAPRRAGARAATPAGSVKRGGDMIGACLALLASMTFGATGRLVFVAALGKQLRRSSVLIAAAAAATIIWSPSAQAQCAGTTCTVASESDLRTAVNFANATANTTINITSGTTVTLTSNMPILTGTGTTING